MSNNTVTQYANSTKPNFMMLDAENNNETFVETQECEGGWVSFDPVDNYVSMEGDFTEQQLFELAMWVKKVQMFPEVVQPGL